METAPEKIIVFHAYNTVVNANLAKTKLDAFGIPCFLTDENFVSLYPIQNELFPGIRLYIFEKDLARVKEVLEEEKTLKRHCPVCYSTDLAYEPSREGKLSFLITELKSLLFLPTKKVYHCENCHHEFESPDGD